MPTRSRLPDGLKLAERILEEGLASFIEKGRAAGQSWDTLAKELYIRTEREVDVNGVTLSAWAERLRAA